MKMQAITGALLNYGRHEVIDTLYSLEGTALAVLGCLLSPVVTTGYDERPDVCGFGSLARQSLEALRNGMKVRMGKRDLASMQFLSIFDDSLTALNHYGRLAAEIDSTADAAFARLLYEDMRDLRQWAELMFCGVADAAAANDS